jgi:hypothetical protein
MPDPTHFDPLISIAGSASKSVNVDSGSGEISTSRAYVAAAAPANDVLQQRADRQRQCVLVDRAGKGSNLR